MVFAASEALKGQGKGQFAVTALSLGLGRLRSLRGEPQLTLLGILSLVVGSLISLETEQALEVWVSLLYGELRDGLDRRTLAAKLLSQGHLGCGWLVVEGRSRTAR